MNPEIEQVLQSLNSIQGDLVGIIIATVSTAVLSLLTLIVNSAIKLLKENRKYNSKQRKNMQTLYFCLQKELQSLKVLTDEIAQYTVYCQDGKISSAIKVYFDRLRDETTFDNTFVEYEQKPLYLDSMEKFIKLQENIKLIFDTKEFPAMPLWKPCLKSDIYDMLNELHYWSNYICIEIDNTHNYDYQTALNKYVIDSGKLTVYLALLNTW